MSRRSQARRLKDTILSYPGYSAEDVAVSNYVAPRLNDDPMNDKPQREWHEPGANFCGPGTDIRRRLAEGVKPTTQVDRQCVKHDIDYWNIQQLLKSKKISRDDAKKRVRATDDRLIGVSRYNAKYPENPLDKIHANITLAGIRAKEIAEDAGILSPTRFVGGQYGEEFDVYEFLNGIIDAKKPDPLKKFRRNLIRADRKKRI